MREILFTVEPTNDNRWVARSTNESIETYADSIDELRLMVREAVNWRFVHDPSSVVIKLKVSNDKVFGA